MRVVIDPQTGEMLEVVDGNLVGTEPYDYAEAKRAVMAASKERREAEKKYRDAVIEKANSESEYRKLLAVELLKAKDQHGATVAEAVAKGVQSVVDAKRRALAADGLVKAYAERLRLCSEDRASLHRLIEWSQTHDRFNQCEQP